MRTGFVVIVIVLGFAGLVGPVAPGARAQCPTCNDATSPGQRSVVIVSRLAHRPYRTQVSTVLPAYWADLPACYWRKLRLWNPDGQYWLVSRVQFCR